MRLTHAGLLGALALGVFAAPAARADTIELVGGRAVQGKLLAGQTGEDGLAVELFDTGGTIVIRWDHIIPARRKQLRIDYGVDPPPIEQVEVDGHRVLLVTGRIVEGRALNLSATNEPLQLKQRKSVQHIDRSQIATVTETKLPGVFVFEPEELYQQERDRNPPVNAAMHRELGLFAMNVGDLAHAKEHLDAASADAAFAASAGGRDLQILQRQLEVLIKSKGAQEMAAQITAAMRANTAPEWNRALTLVNDLDKTYPDEQVRKLIHIDVLKSTVSRDRRKFFQREVQKDVIAAMNRFIEQKSREKKKPLDPNESPTPGVAVPGSLAAARQWLAKDLPKLIWEKVIADNGITSDEMEVYWKERASKKRLTASYGTGSFIVVKKKQKPNDPKRPEPGRPRGAERPQQGGAPRQAAKEDKPLTEEEWFEQRGSSDRGRWMTAWFAETSGMFEVIHRDESELCGGCAGTGAKKSSNADGSVSSTICTECNGSAVFVKVVYR